MIDYFKEGLLMKSKHPTLPLEVINYTKKTQYEKLWDKITLNRRCYIQDTNGKFITKAFDKFFNLEELDKIPNGEFKILEKLDGCFGMVFYYEDQWVFASKGSFTSIYAEELKRLFYKFNYDKLVNKKYTYAFEIISDKTKIVLKYPKERLVLLGIFNKGVEVELPHKFPDVPKEYDFDSNLEDLKGFIKDDEEGYVIKFRSGERLKIKGKTYLELHKLFTKVSDKQILKFLSENKLNLLIDNTPDEWYQFVKEKVKKFKRKFWKIKIQLETEYYRVLAELPADYSKKDFALEVNNKRNRSAMFVIENNKNLDEYVWKQMLTA